MAQFSVEIIRKSGSLLSGNQQLWRSLKQEAVYLHELQDGFQAKRIIDEWLEFYNAERPHTALDKRTPYDAYFDPTQMKKAA
jgi:putative transposase